MIASELDPTFRIPLWGTVKDGKNEYSAGDKPNELDTSTAVSAQARRVAKAADAMRTRSYDEGKRYLQHDKCDYSTCNESCS